MVVRRNGWAPLRYIDGRPLVTIRKACDPCGASLRVDPRSVDCPICASADTMRPVAESHTVAA